MIKNTWQNNLIGFFVVIISMGAIIWTITTGLDFALEKARDDVKWMNASLQDFTSKEGYEPLNKEITRQTDQGVKHIKTSLVPARNGETDIIYGISKYSLDSEYRTVCFKAEENKVTIIKMVKSQDFVFCGFD